MSRALASALTASAVVAFFTLVVIERGGRRAVPLEKLMATRNAPSELLYADPAYIKWLGDLEEDSGETHEFSNQLTPSSIVELPLGYYRPEVRCHNAPCEAYTDKAPREPSNYIE